MTTKEFEEKESPISDELRTLLREQDVLYYHYWNKLYDNLQLPDTKEIDFGKGCTAIEIVQRTCTTDLKVNTTARYMRRELGIVKYRNLLGIRKDEPRRVQKALKDKGDCKVEHPLYHAGITEEMINDYWKHSSFDLGIRSDQGNCDLCFLKGRDKLLSLIREDPERTQWWIDQEKAITVVRPPEKPPITFSKRYSFTELLSAATSQPDLFDGIPDDEEPVSCFCGD